MGFSEALKLEVKRKAHFRCCMCESVCFVQVHHIVPISAGGLDSFDNAAPLCPNCHDSLGANPEKRKWIKDKRDFIYEFCKKRLAFESVNRLEELYNKIEDAHREQANKIDEVELSVAQLKEENRLLKNQLHLLKEQQTKTTKGNLKRFFDGFFEDNLLKVIPEGEQYEPLIERISALVIYPGLITIDEEEIYMMIKYPSQLVVFSSEARGTSKLENVKANLINQAKKGGLALAENMIFNVRGDACLTLYDVNEVAEVLYNGINNPNANIIFGATVDESLRNKLSVTVLASFPQNKG